MWVHPTLLLVHVGLMFGPWRDALDEAACEEGLTGQDDEPFLNRQLLLRVLRACACKMHGRSLSAWGPNVARGSAFHSGGIVWMKHLRIVEKSESGDHSLEMGSAGTWQTHQWA